MASGSAPNVILPIVDSIEINAGARQIYEHFQSRPNKFPSSKLFETRPFLLVRMLGTGSANGILRMMRIPPRERKNMVVESLKEGDKFGPFSVTAVDPGNKVRFKLYSALFDMDIDMIFTDLNSNRCRLSMHIYARSDNFLQRFVLKAWKPLHHVMAQKMLLVYKQDNESFNS